MSCKAFAVPKSSRHVYAITYGLACDGSRGSSPRRAQGHAQPGAPPALAARLSHERATAVVTQLAAGGVARERLRSAAYSNRRPLIGVRGGEASRRVEIYIFQVSGTCVGQKKRECRWPTHHSWGQEAKYRARRASKRETARRDTKRGRRTKANVRATQLEPFVGRGKRRITGDEFDPVL